MSAPSTAECIQKLWHLAHSHVERSRLPAPPLPSRRLWRFPLPPAAKRLPLAQAVKWGADVAKGLVELHRLGVVCADLKPDNVLIDDDLGDAVVADFGISSVVAGTLCRWVGV